MEERILGSEPGPCCVCRADTHVVAQLKETRRSGPTPRTYAAKPGTVSMMAKKLTGTRAKAATVHWRLCADCGQVMLDLLEEKLGLKAEALRR